MALHIVMGAIFTKYAFNRNLSSNYLDCYDDFLVTANRFADGGEEQTSVTSLAACQKLCRESKLADERVCYGFDFDSGNACWFHLSNYTLNSQSRTDVNNSRRIFKCPTGKNT